MYTITARYQTGDSFNSYDTSDTLEAKWTLDVAKENLKRIKEHYKAYQDRNNYYSMSFHKEGESILEKIKNEPWFYEDKDETYRNSWTFSVVLLENDGSSKEYPTSWTGYFERLYGANIAALEEDDMSFEI